ncbi:MAG: helix-turn-helix domain-containing protein [Lachnospiraceae bacterium]|nr:helix-turn-helix domain-containing protein [Lachnospiraceae bacterium]
MDETPNYFAIIPADVRYDSELTANEKLMYGEISSLCHKEGYCYCNNNYFSKLYKATKDSVSRWIRHLAKRGYIRVQVIRNDKKVVIERRIYLELSVKKGTDLPAEMTIPPDNNDGTLPTIMSNPPDNNVVYNNININNTSNNINSEKTKKFSPPSVDEVREFIKENGYHVDPEQFVDYYESVGWKVGKDKPMKDWRASVRTWERKNNGINNRYTPKANGVDTF